MTRFNWKHSLAPYSLKPSVCLCLTESEAVAAGEAMHRQRSVGGSVGLGSPETEVLNHVTHISGHQFPGPSKGDGSSAVGHSKNAKLWSSEKISGCRPVCGKEE